MLDQRAQTVSKALAKIEDPSQRYRLICKLLAESYGFDRVELHLHSELKSTEKESLALAWPALDQQTYRTPFGICDGRLLALDQEVKSPLVISDVGRSLKHPSLLQDLMRQGVKSLAVFSLKTDQNWQGWIELHQTRSYRRWLSSDLDSIVQALSCFKISKQELGIALSQFRKFSSYPLALENGEITGFDASYRRLTEFGNILIVRTDPSFVIGDIIGNCENILGLSKEELINAPRDLWKSLFHKEDFRRLLKRVRELRKNQNEVSEEFRVINRSSGKQHWIIAHGVPLFSLDNTLVGWECIGLDITPRRQAQHELVSQSKRVEALYKVSRALQFSLDPALVTLKGLQALIDATSSDSGLGFSYDHASDQLELVAAEGVSSEYINAVEAEINGASLVRRAVESKEALLIDNISEDPEAVVKLVRQEGLKATIVTPLCVDGSVLGAIVLFCKQAKRYNRADLELAEAASNQIALATRQAELYASEKRQAGSFAALYRLSHELSQHLTPKEISQHSFSILHEELACKRMWLGILNDRGTHLVGQAGFGPGIRKRIIDIQIELALEHNFLDQALAQKEPVVVYPDDELRCSALTKVIKKLKLGPFVIVPLVAAAKVVGVIVIEPSVASGFFSRSKLSFLSTMASEIGVVLLARRFEHKLSEADKMRMAGVLASGVAHNFNNLLQAVMGQASLIEMQAQGNRSLIESASTIKQAADKGATLINQLLSFSQADVNYKEKISLNSLIAESEDFYRSILGREAHYKTELSEEAPAIIADRGQLQHVITNILSNAKDALTNGAGKVSISTALVRLKSGEVSPELSPGYYLRVTIEDDGIGMDEEKKARCFEPFFTTKNVDNVTGIGITGSGLGLSSAYSIVKQHGGSIVIESQAKQGTQVIIYLPSAETRERDRSLRSPLSHSNGSPQAILIGLEEASYISTQSAIESLGLETLTCGTQQRAMELVKTCENLKLAIIDVDRLGIEALDFIRYTIKEVDKLSVFVSTFNTSRWRELLDEYQSVQVLSKPIELLTVHRLIKGINSDRSLETQLVVSSNLSSETVAKKSGFHPEKSGKLSQLNSKDSYKR